MNRRSKLVGGLVLLACAVGVFPAAALADGIAVSPQTSGGAFDFGTVEIGHSMGQTFHMTNLLSTKTQPLRVRLSGSSTFKKSRDTCNGKRLAPGKSCLVRVNYTPTTDGQTDTTSLTVNNKALSLEYGAINLSGTGHGTASLVWTDTSTSQPISSYDFGTTGGTHQFTLTNVGTAPAFIVSSGQGFDATTLFADRDCGAVIGPSFAPGATCTETWTFNPANCSSSGSLAGGSSIQYYTDSTHTTVASATLSVTATCP